MLCLGFYAEERKRSCMETLKPEVRKKERVAVVSIEEIVRSAQKF